MDTPTGDRTLDMEMFASLLCGYTDLGKEYATSRSKFFPLQVASIFERFPNTRKATSCLQKLSPLANWWESLSGVFIHLNGTFLSCTLRHISLDLSKNILLRQF